METDPTAAPSTSNEPRFCAQCGKPAGALPHDRCATRLELEPPRYCTECARRMVVQVVPTGWTARCSEHGITTSANVEAGSGPDTPAVAPSR